MMLNTHRCKFTITPGPKVVLYICSLDGCAKSFMSTPEEYEEDIRKDSLRTYFQSDAFSALMEEKSRVYHLSHPKTYIRIHKETVDQVVFLIFHWLSNNNNLEFLLFLFCYIFLY